MDPPARPQDTPSSDQGHATLSARGFDVIPNGRAAAAILAAGIAFLALGLLSFAGDMSHAVRVVFIIWSPSGPLSGVSTATVAIWLAAWFVLFLLWKDREVRLPRINLVSFAMAGAGMLLTFPPFADWLQGK